MSYFYRGRHRRPTHAARRAATVAAGGALLVGGPGVLSALTAGTASAATVSADRTRATLDAIAGCESGTGPTSRGVLGAVNPRNHAHFGLFQFDLATWRSVGGTGNPVDASRPEQYLRAALLLESRGTQPWAQSASCWRPAARPIAASDTVITRAPTGTIAPTPAPAAGTYRVVRGDSLWRIAQRHYGTGTAWHRLYANNRSVIGGNPALIQPGQVFKL